MKKLKQTILLVEDEEGVRQNIAQYLTLQEFVVLEASDGVSAFELYEEMKPDLIITDINMPQMDGLTLVEAIRKTDSSTPVIIVSAHSETPKLLRAIKLNLIEYIIKPVTRSVLKELVTKALKYPEDIADTTVTLGYGFSFNTSQKTLLLHGEYVNITQKQRLLLELLVERKNQIVAAEDIFFHLNKDYSLEFSSGTVRNLIKRMREILPEDILINVYGGGYMLQTSSQNIEFKIPQYEELLEAVAIFDVEHRLIECNAMILQLFHCKEKSEVIGKSIYAFALETESHKITHSLKHKEFTIDAIFLQRSDKEIFLAKTKAKNSIINNQEVRIVSIADLTDMVKLYSKDVLTSLDTRAVLEVEFENLMASKISATAIFVDIDDFKDINDTYGHIVGDEVIKRIAELMLSAVRKDDVLVRWGGDEFLIVLFDTTLKDAQKAAENLRQKINALKVNDVENVSCSFGIDAIRHNDTLDTLISRIDQALYNAKKNSKNCIMSVPLEA